jgi:hypothetical protein
MATEKQIAANRANAQKSTGPRTTAGRLKSSRNAYRHGLSLPLWPDMETSAKADAIVRAVIGEDVSDEQLMLAVEFAQAQLELLRIRTVRREILGSVDILHDDANEMGKLAALDRYERYAHTRRRRASQKLCL